MIASVGDKGAVKRAAYQKQVTDSGINKRVNHSFRLRPNAGGVTAKVARICLETLKLCHLDEWISTAEQWAPQSSNTCAQ